MMITEVQQLESLSLIVRIKNNPVFVDEIQAMIDKDPRKSIKSSAGDGSVWVSYLAGGA